MAACDSCGHCRTCDTYDHQCTCCPHHGGELSVCGCQYCEDCECTEPPDNWCPHGCDHCADCCNWNHAEDGEEEEHDDELCCSVSARTGEEAADSGDNDYLDEVFGEKSNTPEELVNAWQSRNGNFVKSMEGDGGARAKGCPVDDNVVHTGKDCKYGYRHDLVVIHHRHTAKDGTVWATDFVYYGWGSEEKKPEDAHATVFGISAQIHSVCSR